MNLKFRKALSLLCAISMLLTSIPFLAISEESVGGIDASANLPEQVLETAEEMVPNTPPEEGSEETEPAEAPAAEEPEQDVPAMPEMQDDTPAEPETPAQEEEVQNPGIEMDDSDDRVIDFEEEQAQVVEQVEIAGATQITEPQSVPETQQEETVKAEQVNEPEQTQEETTQEEEKKELKEEPAQTNQDNHDEEETVTTDETDLTISEEIQADHVTAVSPEASDVNVWNVNGDLEAGKETVIRIISTSDARLYFQLTSDCELEAALTDENNENRELFSQDETEESNTLKYSLNAVHFEEDGSQLIHIVSAANGSFDLQILTAAAWAAQQNTELLEENVPQVATGEEGNPAENTEGTTAEQSEEADQNEEETEPEEIPVFELDEDTLVRYNGEDTNVIVPDGIREIGSRAFYGNGTIQTVTLPDSVEIINNAAFADCVNLEKVILSEQSQLVTIGNGAFKNDTKLDISFAENVPNVLTNAFEGIGKIAEEEAEETDEDNKETEETLDPEKEEKTEESEKTEETKETADNQLVFEGEDFTLTVTYSEDAQMPEGTELTVLEILPETEEYEAYFSLTDEERAAIWNAVAEEGRLFLITLRCNEEEVTPAAPIQVQVIFAEEEILWAESPMTFEGEDFTVIVTFSEDVQFPAGTELTVQEILPETEEYEAYFSLTDEESSAIWNMIAEGDRLFRIAFLYNEEDIIPQGAVDIVITLAEPEAFLEAGQMIFEGEDFTVTVNFGDDAQFPVGTELFVREILPDTPEYALYSGMTDEALNEDWAEITLERYFDIAFIANEEEIEPKGYVDVQITFHEKIEQNEEIEVQAVHFENNEANVIEVGTDSTTVAVEDEEAIDTVTFTSDSFSVYGVVQKKKIITKTLVAGGNTYEIEVTYAQEAEIPENAEVVVEEIPEGSDLWEAYRKQTAAALNADDVRLPGLYDISIVDEEGNKVEPKAQVNVAIKLANAESTEEEIHVVHFTEEMPQEFVESIAQAAAEPQQQSEEQNTESPTEQTEEQTEVQTPAPSEPLAEEDKIASETLDASVEGDTVTFDTQGFSVYAFAYTVDFHYIVDGKLYDFSIPGGGYISISELIEVLHIPTNRAAVSNSEETVEEVQGEAEKVYFIPNVEISEATRNFVDQIESIQFSSPELVSVSKVETTSTVGQIKENLNLACQYSTELTEKNIEDINSQTIQAGDWVLISVLPFTTEEWLTVTLKDSEVFTIKVTDAQIKTTVKTASGDLYEIIITYNDTAEIPEDAQLVVREIMSDEDKYANNLDTVNSQLIDMEESTVDNPVQFEISIISVDGEEIEPRKGSLVNVEILLVEDIFEQQSTEVTEDDNSNENNNPQIWFFGETAEAIYDGSQQSFSVIHLTKENKVELIDNLTSSINEDNRIIIQFETESFSDYVIQNDTDEDALREALRKLPDVIYVGDRIYLRKCPNVWATRIDNIVRETKHDSDITPNYKTIEAINDGDFYLTPSDNWNYWGTGLDQNKIYKHIEVRPRRTGTTPPAEIETVNNADVGIKLDLFDYDIGGYLDNRFNNRDIGGDTSLSWFLDESINAGHALKFTGSGITNENDGINKYTETKINPGIVANNLVRSESDGKYYPVLAGGGSLAYLFNSQSDGTKKIAYTGADKLFKKVGDYYIYDSDQNYAYYNASENRFHVYEHTYEQKSRTDTGIGAISGELVSNTNGKAIGFFPFHPYDEAYDLFVNWNPVLNHHFGLTMSVDFMLPPDPKAVTDSSGNPIVFDFSGDDDMWVFIDGKLAMDIGGVHQPLRGTINFQNHTVTVNGSTQMTQTKFDETFPDLYDGKKHTLQVFYIERGGCDSNCKIEFNLTQYGNLKFNKKNDNNQELEGAIFGIYKDQACTDPLKETLTDGTVRSFVKESGTDGKVEFKGLPIGTYYLKELKSPDGYALDTQIQTVNVFANGPDVKVTIGNKPNDKPADNYQYVYPNTKPAPIELQLEKVWTDEAGQTINAPSDAQASFKLKRFRTYETNRHDFDNQPLEGEGKNVSILTIGLIDKDNNKHKLESFDFIKDSNTEFGTCTINWSYVPDYNGTKGSTVQGSSETSATFYVSDGYELYIKDDTGTGDAIKEISINGNQFFGNSGGGWVQNVTFVTEPDTEYSYSPPEVILQNGLWNYNFTNLPVTETRDNKIYNYSYYIVEVSSNSPEGTIVVYKDSSGRILNAPIDGLTSTSTTETVENRIPNGSLIITKTIKKNGQTDTDATGTYWFGVYKGEYNAETNATPVRKISITIDNADNGTDQNTVEYLPYAEYYVYELTEENGTPITGNTGTIDGILYTVSSTNNPATLNTENPEKTIDFINEKTTIKVKKEWSGNDTQPVTLKLIRYKKDTTGQAISTGTTSDGNASVILYLDYNLPNDSTGRKSNVGITLNVPKDSYVNLTYSDFTFNANNTWKPASKLMYWDTISNPDWHHWAEFEVICNENEGPVTNKQIHIGNEDEYCVWIVFDYEKRNIGSYELTGSSTGTGTGTSGTTGSGISGIPDDYIQDNTFTGNIINLPDGNAWEKEVTNLPIYDEDGNVYYYGLVEEDIPFGYNVTYTPDTPVIATQTDAIVLKAKNTYQEPEKETIHDQVTLYKFDENNNPLENAVFALFNNSECTGDPIKTYYAGNGTSINEYIIKTEDVSSLPTSNGESITLYLKETQAPEGYYLTGNEIWPITINTTVTNPTSWDHYVITTTYEMKIGENDSIEIHNWPLTSVTVDKTWKQADGELITDIIQNASVTVKLTDGNGKDITKDSNGNQIHPVTLPISIDDETDNTETSPWQYTWSNLPKYDDNKNEIQYTVVETSAKIGTEELLTNPVTATKDDNGQQHLVNTLPKTNIKVKKTWPDGQTSAPEGTEVEFTIHATIPGESGETPAAPFGVPAVSPDKVTLDGVKDTGDQIYENIPWEYEWRDLPKYDNHGTLIEYSVTETGYHIGTEFTATQYPQPTSKSENNVTEFTFKNTLPDTERHAVKVWVENEDARKLRPDSITFTLSATVGTDENPVTIDLKDYGFEDSFIQQTVTADNNGNMHADWTGLPVYAKDGSKIKYTATEIEPTRYTQTDMTYDEGTFTWTFTNTLISLKIIKDDANNEQKKLSGAVFELRRYNGTEFEAVTDESIVGVGADGRFTVDEEIVLNGITDGDYQIEEISAPSGYVKYSGTIDFEVENGTIIYPNDSEENLIIRYHAKTEDTDPEFLIGNTPGVELPSTGGSGTLAYTLSGLALIMLAGGLLAVSKRRTAREHK